VTAALDTRQGPFDHGGVRGARHLVWCLVLLTGACSSGSDSPEPTAKPETESPNATIAFDGSRGVAGRVADPDVRCNWPDLEGQSIALLARLSKAGSLARIQLRPDHVEVFIGSGEGDDYQERSFEGTGVTSFDAAGGAEIDSTLTETTAPGSTTSDVGSVSAIRGSVACGDQTPGESNVTITGDTLLGPVAGAVLDPVRVECADTPAGNEVTASGLVQVGSDTVLMSVGLASDRTVTVNKATAAGSGRYHADQRWVSSANGAYVEADVVEQTAAAPRTLHLQGDLTCGRNAAG
jgi:hypothetical protein